MANHSVTFASSELILHDNSALLKLLVDTLIKEQTELNRLESSAKRTAWNFDVASFMSLMYIRNRSGPRIEPWGTPVLIGRYDDSVEL